MRMPQISRARAIAYALLVLVVLALGGRLALARDDAGPAAVAIPPAPQPDEPTGGLIQADSPPARVLLVHVVGAVRRPGLYRLPEGSRVADALRRAGGARERAALELVNLASPVADGQQVVVPHAGEAEASEPSPAGQGGAAPPQPVLLNSATLEELDTLPGVGPITAQKILDYRTEHGAFGSVEELDAVPGIGPATLAELTPLVGL
jgi:competence protein ComEA